MAEVADKIKLQRMIQMVREAARWEREATLLGTAEYDGLMRGLDALAQAVDLLTPALPEELQP